MNEQAQAILNELNRKAALDPQLRKIMKKIEKGKATFEDTALLSQRMSTMLGELFGASVLDIPEDAREAVCTALLKEQYNFTNETLEAVQEALDAPLGISLEPQRASFPSERVEQLAHALIDPTVAEKTIQRRADKPVATVSKSFHDDYIKTNAKLRSQLGLKPTITRYGTGCCTWCASVAGKYRFGEQPDDIFRRHDNCDCVIIYDTQVLRGEKTEDGGRSKKWVEVDPHDLEADPPKVFTERESRDLEARMYEQFRELQYDSQHPITDTRNIKFELQRVTTAQNPVFVSDGARKTAKPKQIHTVDTHFTEAIKMLGIQNQENLPPVHVLDGLEMGSGAVASYSPIKNALNINLAVATYDKAHVPTGMERFAGYKDDRSSYLHELLHWQDAEKFRRRHGEITEQNYSEYIDFINRDAKKKLDKLAKKGYNIGEISKYARDKYLEGQYYETYTEYRVSQLLRK